MPSSPLQCYPTTNRARSTSFNARAAWIPKFSDMEHGKLTCFLCYCCCSCQTCLCYAFARHVLSGTRSHCVQRGAARARRRTQLSQATLRKFFAGSSFTHLVNEGQSDRPQPLPPVPRSPCRLPLASECRTCTSSTKPGMAKHETEVGALSAASFGRATPKSSTKARQSPPKPKPQSKRLCNVNIKVKALSPCQNQMAAQACSEPCPAHNPQVSPTDF